MSVIMMQLGDYQFGIQTAAYDSLQRSTSFEWATQKRIGKAPAKQFTGPGDDKITLEGRVFPHSRGGLDQVENMRTQAAAGEPLVLVDGLGNILGDWIIRSVDEGQGHFATAGIPLRQSFSMKLERYEDA